MRYLVTGGAGYIGSHMCKALHQAGHEPIVVDNLSNGHAWAVKWGPLEVADIRDSKTLLSILDTHKPDGVFHFSGLIEVGESVRHPDRFYDNNVAGSISLLNAMKEGRCRNIVFSSTCATYGIPDVQPIPEDTPQSPINPYGHSKLMIETILRDYAQCFGFNVAMLRYFNASGADPDGEIGEAHNPETHLIPRVLMAARGEIEKLDLFGNDFPTEDGTAVRDYIHVCDLVEGHLLTMKLLEQKKGRGEGGVVACNLGTGRGLSVLEIIKSVERVTGRNVPYTIAPRRPGDCPMLVSDTTLASELLGFKPRYPEVDEIISTAWSWHQNDGWR